MKKYYLNKWYDIIASLAFKQFPLLLKQGTKIFVSS